MEGVIINYRRGRKTQTMNQMVILFDGVVDKAKATSLIGKEVVYTCSGKAKKLIKGKVTAAHGSKGAIRALFETGMPGQAIGGKVNLN